MSNIFELFKATRPARPAGKVVSAGDVYFRICFDNSDRACLKVTDKSGAEIEVDYRCFTGDMFLLLRSISAIKESKASTLAWDVDSNEIYLDENPQLLYTLFKCKNLADAQGQVLTFLDTTYQVQVDIQQQDVDLIPCLSLQKLDGEGPSFISDFKLITDVFALCGNNIVRIKPIGEDFSKLHTLAQPFMRNIAEQYLSLLMSHFDNLSLTVGGKSSVEVEDPVKAVPAIVFEKVNEDNALFLRLSETVPGVQIKFVEDFAPTKIVSFMPDGRVSVKRVEYSGRQVSAAELKKRICACAPDKKLAKDVYEEDGLFIIPETVAAPFLVKNLSVLAKEYVLIGSDELGKYKIRAVAPKFTFKQSSGIDFLESSAEIQIQDTVYTIADFLAQYRKNHYIELSDGEKGIIDEAYARKIERLFGKSKKNAKLSFFDLPEVTALMEDIPDEGIFRKSREFYRGFNAIAGSEDMKVKGLKGTLRPYQQNGVKWLKYLYDNDFGGCLADDMGLGKTIQTISLLLLAYSGKRTKPSLIVMPRTLLFNWKAEFAKFAPGIKLHTYYGPDRNFDEAECAQVILTTYAIVRNDIEQLSTKEFHCIVLDESQNIKNMSAKASQAVMLLKADHRFALSGTPIENRLDELYSLFRFLNPGMFGSVEDFNVRYGNPIQRDADKDVMMQLKSRINPFLLRRVKEDVLTDLPERIDQAIRVEMEPEHAAFYETRRRYYYDTLKTNIKTAGLAKSQFEMLQALTELRRIASVPESLSDGRIKSSKIPVIADAVLEAVENGHKVVVFFNFIAGIELLGEELEKEKVGYVVMTGATTDRESIVERFQNDRNCMVLLMTLKTGGVGLNLTAADTVFIAEPWWNNSAQEQAIARLHRIGQKSVVHSFSVITTSSIEEKILQLQEQKSALVDALISSDSSTAKVLTEEDIDFILG